MSILRNLRDWLWPATSHVRRGQLWLAKVPQWRHGYDHLDLLHITCVSTDGGVITSCPPRTGSLPAINSPGPALSLRDLVRTHKLIPVEEAEMMGYVVVGEMADGSQRVQTTTGSIAVIHYDRTNREEGA